MKAFLGYLYNGSMLLKISCMSISMCVASYPYCFYANIAIPQVLKNVYIKIWWRHSWAFGVLTNFFTDISSLFSLFVGILSHWNKFNIIIPPVCGGEHWCLSARLRPTAASSWAHSALIGRWSRPSAVIGPLNFCSRNHRQQPMIIKNI